MSFLSIAIAVAVTAGCLYLLVRVHHLSRRLHRLIDSHARAVRKLEFVENSVTQDIAKLNFELKKYQGDLTFHADMTFSEALAVNVRVQDVMNEMHVGGCPDCKVELNQTLAYGAAINSVSPEAFLIALNNLEAPANQPKQPSIDSELKLL